jgi:HAD superfamily hydrolase (TIGR01490 family)
MEKQPVAVFDIDGTIYRSSLTIDLVEKLIDSDVFPREARKGYETEREKWLERKGDYEAYTNKIVTVFWNHIKGIPYGVVADAAGEVIEARRGRTYRYTRDLVHALKKKGYFLLAISHSPKLIVDGFAYELGFDKAYGTLMETGPSGRFTGEGSDIHLIGNKARILERAIEKENLTLSKSVGVGDTDSDIPFLEMVEQPIAFNPNKRLYDEARRRQWKTIVERKDVIYEL